MPQQHPQCHPQPRTLAALDTFFSMGAEISLPSHIKGVSSFGNGTFVRVCASRPPDAKMHPVKWTAKMDAHCNHIGIVSGGSIEKSASQVILVDDWWYYHDAWLTRVAEEDVDVGLRDTLRKRLQLVQRQIAKSVFAGQSTLNFHRPVYVRVRKPESVPKGCVLEWTSPMDETDGRVGVVAGGALSKGVTTVLFEGSEFANYLDTWIVPVDASEVDAAQQERLCAQWSAMRDTYVEMCQETTESNDNDNDDSSNSNSNSSGGGNDDESLSHNAADRLLAAAIASKLRDL